MPYQQQLNWVVLAKKKKERKKRQTVQTINAVQQGSHWSLPVEIMFYQTATFSFFSPLKKCSFFSFSVRLRSPIHTRSAVEEEKKYLWSNKKSGSMIYSLPMNVYRRLHDVQSLLFLFIMVTNLIWRRNPRIRQSGKPRICRPPAKEK